MKAANKTIKTSSTKEELSKEDLLKQLAEKQEQEIQEIVKKIEAILGDKYFLDVQAQIVIRPKV